MNSDYSCYVTIINKTSMDVGLDSDTVNHGSYVTQPASLIRQGQTMSFQLQGSNFGPVGYGADGACQYSYSIGPQKFAYQLAYRCPHLTNDNSASATVNQSNISIDAIPDPIPTGGHPVRIQFTLWD